MLKIDRMNKKYISHLLLWIIILVISTSFRSLKFDFQISLIISLTNILLYIIIFYINYFILFPKFKSRNDKSKYIRNNILVIVLFSFIYTLIEFFFKSSITEIELPRRVFLLGLLRVSASNILIISVQSVILLLNSMREKEHQSKILIEEKLQSELKFLRSQINPHFLFNALNNIYSLSYLKSDKAPEGILLLSKLLRYNIDDCKEDVLPLDSEIDYLETFIAFQNIRTAGEIDVRFECDSVKRDLLISPLLFLPLIENSFKYSKIGDIKDSYIHILMETDKDNQLLFRIKNSIPKTAVSPGAGTGLENLTKRLELVYPKKHDLIIDKQEQFFIATLKINLK